MGCDISLMLLWQKLISCLCLKQNKIPRKAKLTWRGFTKISWKLTNWNISLVSESILKIQISAGSLLNGACADLVYWKGKRTNIVSFFSNFIYLDLCKFAWHMHMALHCVFSLFSVKWLVLQQKFRQNELFPWHSAPIFFKTGR